MGSRAQSPRLRAQSRAGPNGSIQAALAGGGRARGGYHWTGAPIAAQPTTFSVGIIQRVEKERSGWREQVADVLLQGVDVLRGWRCAGRFETGCGVSHGHVPPPPARSGEQSSRIADGACIWEGGACVSSSGQRDGIAARQILRITPGVSRTAVGNARGWHLSIAPRRTGSSPQNNRHRSCRCNVCEIP